MSPPKRDILIVEDVASLAMMYTAYLSGEPVNIATASSGEEALAKFSVSIPEVVVLDVNLPGRKGLDILREIKARQYPTEVIIMTAQGSVNLAVEAMRDGAHDFLVKPFSPERLQVTVRNALDRRGLIQRVEALECDIPKHKFCDFIGDSLPMQAVYRILRSAAKSKATVFISGESGTGKELCAHALHQLSDRQHKPFVALNCAAIPHQLLESELFGHLKGSFSGANADRQGAALSAHGGTLFLDEIGELDLTLQAKILRFVQTGMVQRVGEDSLRPADVRLVAATNRNIREQVARGAFREDLFYRLFVIPVDMPPLRAREGDVLQIARHFLKQYAHEDGKSFTGFDPEAQETLLRYCWPGNVRELQNVVRKIVVLSHGDVVTYDMLPEELKLSQPAQISAPSARVASADVTDAGTQPLEDIIDGAIDSAIAHCGGSIPKAASQLRVSPSTIYRRLQSRVSK